MRSKAKGRQEGLDDDDEQNKFELAEEILEDIEHLINELDTVVERVS